VGATAIGASTTSTGPEDRGAAGHTPKTDAVKQAGFAPQQGVIAFVSLVLGPLSSTTKAGGERRTGNVSHVTSPQGESVNFL
ncbi:unnamed protein product, partial [Amoebophrya sp. A25]